MSEEAAQTNTDATAENSSGDPAATETQQADLAADAGTTDEGVTTEESTTDGTDESTDQTDEGEQAAVGAPENYEAFTLPEGMEVSEEDTKAFGEVAKELNLSQEQAQKLVELEGQREMAKAENVVKAYQAQTLAWKGETLALPEFKGEEGKANMASANKAINELGTPELKEMLGLYDPKKNPRGLGLGNHPAMAAFFLNLGKKIGDDGVVHGTGDARSNKSREEIMYGKEPVN
ncbi:MAG: hypothetical protein GY753_09785 [Gammaproteobacteria bacterium]|nr:hypothetical protein [Gammaproteobacteria bacterium]